MTDVPVSALLKNHQPAGQPEAADLQRLTALLEAAPDPWHRATPLHLTASAVIVHPPTTRVLLRWHERQQAWLQVGGHADPGEGDPLTIALREGAEETGLTDLRPWPESTRPRLIHVAIVPVPAKDADDPAHEHGDLRFMLATEHPEAANPERATAPLQWFSVPEAIEATTEANLKETLARVATTMAKEARGSAAC